MKSEYFELEDDQPRTAEARVIVQGLIENDPETLWDLRASEICGGDHELRDRVDVLLRAQRAAARSEPATVLTPATPLTTPCYETAEEETGAGDTIGPYRVIEQLGEGGMGVVYMAEQRSPIRRLVALKVVKSGMDTRQVIARFEAERQALALMNHPNIARVLDAGTTAQGRPYFVMDLVRGIPITDYCDQHRLDRTARLELFVKVCQAVQHAHQKGVIHRDLKPTNVLVELHDIEHVPKVIDFGLAKATSQPLTDRTLVTHFSQMVGTPLYMSPEQAELSGLDVDTRSDIYSLGVLLYVLLTGSTPFDREKFKTASLDEIRRMIREDQPPKPSQRLSTLDAENLSTLAERQQTDGATLCRGVQRELDWVVMKALDKDRSRRYESAGAFADDIRRFLEGRAVEACPPSVAYRIRKTVQRHRLGITVATLFLVVLTASGLAAGWQAIELRRAWLESAGREAHAKDLLEGLRYQSSVDHLRQGDLALLADQVRLIESELELDNEDVRGAFVKFLRSSARPTPFVRFTHRAAIHDFDIANGTQIISVDDDGDLVRWNLVDPDQPSQRIGTHGEVSHAIAVSPDGSRAVSGSTSGRLIWWDLTTDQPMADCQPTENGIETVCWSPDGRFVAAGARYAGVTVFDAVGNIHLRIENDHRHESLLFSPDSSELYVPTRTGIDVWNVLDGKRTRSISTDPLENVRAVCLAGPEQDWLVAGERFADSLVVIDRVNGKHLGTVLVSNEYPRTLAASPDGLWLVATYANGQSQLIQLAPRADGTVDGALRLRCRPHAAGFNARQPVHWLDNPDQFISAGPAGELLGWKRSELPPLQIRLPPASVGQLYLNSSEPAASSFSETERSTAQPRSDSSQGGQAARTVEFQRRRSDGSGEHLAFLPKEIRLKNHSEGSNDSISVQTWSDGPSGGLVAAAEGQRIAILHAATAELIAELDSPIGTPHDLQLSDDGKLLVASSGTQICFWRRIVGPDQNDVWQAWGTIGLKHSIAPAVADGGSTVITDDEQQKRLVELDIETGLVKRVHEVVAEQAICVSHDGQMVAAATDRGFRVWQRATGELRMLRSELSQPRKMAFFPGDRVLISGHNDGKIRAWHIPTGQALGLLFEPERMWNAPRSLQISETGRQIMIRYRNHDGLVAAILGRD